MNLTNGLWLPSQRLAAVGGGPGALISSLASYYPLNEASGNAIDVHAGRNGVDTNTVGTFTPGILYATARQHLAGFLEYFAVANNAAFNFTTEMTVAGHLRMDNAIAQMCMIAKFAFAGGGSTNTSWAFQTSAAVTSSGAFRVFIANGNDPGNNFADYNDIPLNNDTWYHGALVFNGALAEPDRVKVYVNAVQCTPSGKGGTWPVSLQASTAEIRIGDFENLGRYWNGQLQGWGLWNKALTQAQLAVLTTTPYPFA